MKVSVTACFSDMSILSRAASHHTGSLKFGSGVSHIHRNVVRSLQSTSTDSTPQTMHLDSENQQEDQG